jgi:hypothetical protein
MFCYHEYRSKKLNIMMTVNFTHGLFLTCTQKFCCIYKLYIAIFTEYTAIFIRTNPLHQHQSHPAFLTWRASFFARGDEYISTLVSDLPTTAPPLGFYPSHPFTPHSSNYISYIDNIKNLGRPCPGHPILCISRWSQLTSHHSKNH